MAMRPPVKLCSALAQALGGLGIASLDAVSLEGDEGIGVLRETGSHRLGQPAMAGIAAQHGFRQFQVEGTGLAGQV